MPGYGCGFAYLGLLDMETVAEGGSGELTGCDDDMALGHEVEHCLNVGFFYDDKVFVGCRVLGAHHSGGSVVEGYAFFAAEGLNAGLVETLLSFYDKVFFVVEEEESHDAPHVVLEVGIIEGHAPAVGCRWKGA